jgi:hypothetical protein
MAWNLPDEVEIPAGLIDKRFALSIFLVAKRLF